MKDYIAPSMDIEIFDSRSDVILTSGTTPDQSYDDWFDSNSKNMF